MLRCTFPPHYISSTTADKANEIGYGEFPSNSLACDNCHMGPLKSCISDNPEGLSFRFSFIFSVAEATYSQLVQRSSVEEEMELRSLPVLRWLTLGAADFPCMHLDLQRKWSLKASSLLHLLPQIRQKPLDSTQHQIWITPAPYWQETGIPETNSSSTR